MRLLPGVIVPNHPAMRPAMKVTDHIYREFGRREGFTMTSGMESFNQHTRRPVVHGAGSWHYAGCAYDCRTHYFPQQTRQRLHAALAERLKYYDVILESTHIHVEIGDALAKKWGLLL